MKKRSIQENKPQSAKPTKRSGNKFDPLVDTPATNNKNNRKDTDGFNQAKNTNNELEPGTHR